MPTPRMKLGTRGETVARRLLERKGYIIREANYRCPWGEVDLVTQQGDQLVFVEVRSRRGRAFGSPEESVTEAKVQRLTAASQHYLQQHGLEDSAWRIDLVAIQFTRGFRLLEVRHLEHAVQL